MRIRETGILLLAVVLLATLVPAATAGDGNLVESSRAEPVTATDWNLLGGTYLNEGRYDLAIAAFDEAIA
ncbi:MAG: tetratricopeptide repeat protein, partial [Methanoregulaceae archaeon]